MQKNILTDWPEIKAEREKTLKEAEEYMTWWHKQLKESDYTSTAHIPMKYSMPARNLDQLITIFNIRSMAIKYIESMKTTEAKEDREFFNRSRKERLNYLYKSLLEKRDAGYLDDWNVVLEKIGDEYKENWQQKLTDWIKSVTDASLNFRNLYKNIDFGKEEKYPVFEEITSDISKLILDRNEYS